MIYTLFSSLNNVFQYVENIFFFILKACARFVVRLFSFFNTFLVVLFKISMWIFLLPFTSMRKIFARENAHKKSEKNDSPRDQHITTNATTHHIKTQPLSSSGRSVSFSLFKGVLHIVFLPMRWILALFSRIFSSLSFFSFLGFLSFKKIKRTPSILQMEATECGSICLSIILAYYGHKLSPDEVREACGVSRDGSKASYILRAARRYHMIAQGYNIQDPNGLDQCPWPCILHWNFDHFVVFEGRRGNTFYINDPAYGRRRLSREEFGRAFTGVVLTLSKNKDFVKKRQKSPLLIFFRYALIGSFFALFAAVLLGILQILPGLVIAGATKGFIDYVFLKSLYHWTPPLALVVVGAVIFQMILMFTQQRLLMRLHTHLTLNLASKVIHKLFYLPLTFFDQRLSGDILYRFSSLQSLIDLLSLGVMGAFINLVSVVVFSFILYIISPTLFTIVCAFIAVRIVIFLFYKMRLRDRNLTYIQDAGRLSGIEMNGLQAIEMLKANNLESVFFKNWAANHDETLTKFNRAFISEQHYGIFLALFASLMPLALLYQGASFVMEGSMSIGTLMAFTTLTSNLDAPIMTLLEFSGNLEKIKASISRIHDILMYKSGDKSFAESLSKATSPRKQKYENYAFSSQYPREKNWLGRIFGSYRNDPTEVIQPEPPKLHSEIFFHNITFGYTLFDPPIFENLSFVIPKGKTVAIVGSSGSGKSTLSKLLCGLYEPKEGEIFWDTLPIRNINSKDKSKLIALVDQDIFFFEGTVRDNLTAWSQNVSDDDLIKALVDVGLYDDLASRGLLRAHVAENGLNFSGGQRQRLELARALVSKPDVFVLDEATSALDTISERKVFDTLHRQNATLLIIAHRLSTIQNADLIYVMDQGKIVQWGRHSDLIDHPGLYQTFLEREALS